VSVAARESGPTPRLLMSMWCLSATLAACTAAPPRTTVQSPEPTAIEVAAARAVDRLTAAWNKHDTDAYAALLDPDVIVAQLDTDSPKPTGRDAMAKSSSQFFEREPNARIEIISRIVDGHWVIERERMTGLSSDTVFWTTAIYEVRDDVVKRMWIVPRAQ
jgi:hypothetical protein